jgi:thymidylate kinase
MRIIVEGADGSGKTTVVNYLAKEFECDIVHMTRWGSRLKKDYLDKLKLQNVILDRSFMSEMIYKQAFGLVPQISFGVFDELFTKAKREDWKIIILSAPIDILKERLTNRGDESSDIIKNISLIDHLYRVYGTTCNVPVFDTTDPNYLESIMEEIKK